MLNSASIKRGAVCLLNKKVARFFFFVRLVVLRESASGGPCDPPKRNQSMFPENILENANPTPWKGSLWTVGFWQLSKLSQFLIIESL